MLVCAGLQPWHVCIVVGEHLCGHLAGCRATTRFPDRLSHLSTFLDGGFWSTSAASAVDALPAARTSCAFAAATTAQADSAAYTSSRPRLLADRAVGADTRDTDDDDSSSPRLFTLCPSSVRCNDSSTSSASPSTVVKADVADADADRCSAATLASSSGTSASADANDVRLPAMADGDPMDMAVDPVMDASAWNGTSVTCRNFRTAEGWGTAGIPTVVPALQKQSTI